MRVRIIGLVAALALAAPAAIAQVSTASAQTAQFYVTGYVLTGYTASGTYTHSGTCAVDPRVIPLGTYFTISGIGTCHAEDTGGAIIGYRIDVWVPSVAQADALTGWHTVTWGESQQVLGYQATRPPAPAPRPRVAVAPTTYYRANSYFHGDAHDDVSPTSSGQPYSLISLHGNGCRTTDRTPYSAGRHATTCH